MTIVLTGGGTAGHVLPNVALLPRLREKFDKIYYIGGEKEGERAMVEAENVPFFPLKCVKFRRSLGVKSMISNAGIPIGYMKSVAEARRILQKLRPDIVFSKGGFVALPVVRAAKKLGIPVVAHESDASMGLANKLSVGACARVCTTFDIGKGDKFVHTGSPIREKIRRGSAKIVAERHGFSRRDLPNLIVLGGSLGASKINNAVFETAADLATKFNIVHVCGKGKTGGVRGGTPNYIKLEFASDIENYLAWADIVVSRAGSNMLCELMILQKPTLFIPLSSGRGDQIDNAEQVSKYDACGVLNEADLTAETFKAGILETYKNRAKYSQNAKAVIKDGTKDIVDTIYGVVCDANYTR
jgi:UDP-N-acetylglucosamine--N-acetylmuramyl-(pentapeptide) pyrophosphoryl-undecaprenol N-acetylglucosamine transferase